MGLSVKVYKNIKITKSDDFDFIAYVIDKRWDDRIKNLQKNKRYKGVKQNCGISYPCSSHNDFRRMLCNMLGFESGEWVQFYSKITPDTPFYEFFEFADNEGCIDWETSEKLYNDFLEYLATAKYILKNNIYAFGIYADWLEIFKCAKDNGVVVFS